MRVIRALSSSRVAVLRSSTFPVFWSRLRRRGRKPPRTMQELQRKARRSATIAGTNRRILPITLIVGCEPGGDGSGKTDLFPVGDKIDESAERHCRRTLGKPGFGVVQPSRAGHVDMDPGGVSSEFLQEHSRRAGAAPARTNVLDVCIDRFQLFAIFVV